MKKKSNKKLLITVTALVLAAAIGAGAFLVLGRKSEPVGVYPFMMVGMDGYWGDTQESYGPVSTDKIQTVYLSDTQTVTEILVAQGDTVKKGDVLMSFDTTLSDLQLERKRLEVEKLKLQLTEAQAELNRILSLEPMKPMEDLPVMPEVNVGNPIPAAYVYEKYVAPGHTGLAEDTAFVCWLKDDTVVTDALLEEMRRYIWKWHNQPALCEHGYIPGTGECLICEPEKCVHDLVKAECPTCIPEICEHKLIKEYCKYCHLCVHEKPQGECEICDPEICEHKLIKDHCKYCHPCVHGKPDGECDVCNPEICEHKQIKQFCQTCNPPKCEHGNVEAECPTCHPTDDGSQADVNDVSASGGYRIQLLSSVTPPAAGLDSYFVIFKVTQGNGELGAPVMWQGVQVSGRINDFTLRYFTPTVEDYTLPEIEDTAGPSIDFGSGFTAAQIAQMRVDQEKKIKELKLSIRMAEAEYKIMLKEVSDGKVYAEIDGKVVSLLTPEEAAMNQQPVLKVSGGGGFFIQGSVSELEKDNLVIGQEVTVNNWNTGMSYTGTVRSIGDFPDANGYWNGVGNPTASYYPFTVFVGEEADLQAGSYASIQYSTSASTAGIYLDNAFIRTEQGRSYVLVRGADGNLEKRYVTIGKSLWGSYKEILSGMTVEDYIAFPYGKHVKEGAPTVESDLSELYSY